MRKLLSILLILPAFHSCTIAQTPSKYAKMITEETSKKHLTILASKEFAGRGTGEEGGRKAANYIAEEFKSYGLKPIVNGNSYFQPVSLLKTSYEVQKFTLGDKALINGKDFYVQGDNNIANYNTNDIVFVGYGIQDEKYNELKSADIKGKVVLVLNDGEPTDQNGNSILTGVKNKSDWSTSRFKRLQELAKLEPKLILATGSQVATMIDRFKGRLTAGRVSLDKGSAARNASQPTPIVNITEEVANTILSKSNTSIAQFKEKANQGVQPIAADRKSVV